MLDMDVAARDDVIRQSESQKRSSQSEFLQAMMAKDQVINEMHTKFLNIKQLETNLQSMPYLKKRIRKKDSTSTHQENADHSPQTSMQSNQFKRMKPGN